MLCYRIRRGRPTIDGMKHEQIDSMVLEETKLALNTLTPPISCSYEHIIYIHAALEFVEYHSGRLQKTSSRGKHVVLESCQPKGFKLYVSCCTRHLMNKGNGGMQVTFRDFKATEYTNT